MLISLKDLKIALADRLIGMNLIFGLVLNAVVWLIILFGFQSSNDPVALHYNIYFSIDKFGDWYRIFFLPISGLFVIIFNVFVLSAVYLEDKYLSYFLAIAITFVQLILILAASLIVIYI